MIVLKQFIRNTDFWKKLEIDDKTLDHIVMSASLTYSPRGNWVFR